VKPLLVGYQVVRSRPGAARVADADQVADGLRRLRGFALDEGFALGPVFVERRVDQPGATLAAVIAAARRSSAAAVAVPTTDDLGGTPRLRWLTRFWLERSGVRVLVVGRVRG
jgi:hypothetical protein